MNKFNINKIDNEWNLITKKPKKIDKEFLEELNLLFSKKNQQKQQKQQKQKQENHQLKRKKKMNTLIII